CSSPVLDLLGVYHLREGNVIRLADRRLLIEEACSGIQSLLAVLAGTIFLLIWTRRPLRRGIVLVATAIVWVFRRTIVRIVAAAYMADRGPFDLSGGWAQGALGVAVFIVARGLTAATDSLLSLPKRVLDLRHAWTQEGLLCPEDQAPDFLP